MRTYNNTSSLIHEIMHALGFLHEQYHKYYPWDDTNPKRAPTADFKTRSGFYTYKGKLGKSEWNKALYSELKETHGNEFGPDFQLSCRHAAISDRNIQHFQDCDLNSVMMYPQLRKAYQKIKDKVTLPDPFSSNPLVASGLAVNASTDCLSNLDVAALKSLYPNPGSRCVKCHSVHGSLPGIINLWHRCQICNAIYCPSCGAALSGKKVRDPTRDCDRHGCNGRTKVTSY